MPLTTLDPQTALLVVDLQTGILERPSVEPIDRIIERARALADAFRRHGLPVVLINVDGGPATRSDANHAGTSRVIPDSMTALVDGLGRQPGDHIVTKHTWGAFTGTGLADHLAGLGVTQVVVTGVSTSAGVESTARHAQENGFHVTFATDAMTDSSAEAHENSLTRIFPRVGETGTTQEIIDLLTATRP
ncbi:cysteine hydrolase family protein [Leifsonia poae]|uniref:cysteine hydrolase family protein n=1 Tax=Leifsonia poae TaxID=110933 RepID=UPI001CBAF063|nr:isochorismatase family protein [Leifsonia poae]